jgi:hypothetical protein
MNQRLESDLREAFSACASRMPGDAALRLRAIDYRPRTVRLSPGLTVGALGGALATAGTVVSVVVLGSAQPAFAGWSAAPSPATGAQATTADAACQAKLAASPGLPGTGTASGWSAVTTDVRGPFTLVIFQDGSSDATCFIGPSFTVVTRNSVGEGSMSVTGTATRTGNGGEASSSIMVEGTESGAITHMTVAHLDSSSDGPYTLAEGQIQPGVTGVTLERSDSSDVQASTGGGWFVAWWPGAQDVTSADITTPSGVHNEPLIAQSPLPPLGAGNRTCNVVNGQTTPTSGVCSEGGDDVGNEGSFAGGQPG